MPENITLTSFSILFSRYKGELETQLKGIAALSSIEDGDHILERAWFLNRDNTSRLLGVMYCGSYAENENGNADDFIYIGMNFHWEKRNIALPNLPDGLGWKKVADTSGQTPEQWFGEYEETYKKSIKINPRTIVVLIAKREESGHASMAALQDNNEA